MGGYALEAGWFTHSLLHLVVTWVGAVRAASDLDGQEFPGVCFGGH